MKYKIYYLTSLKDNYNPVYIGVTTQSLMSRLGKHRYDSKIGNSKIHNWIKNKTNSNDDILINLIDEVDSDAFFWEDFYIDLMKSWGFSLKNMLYSGYSEKNVNSKGRMSNDAREKLSKLYSGSKLNRDRVNLSIKNRLISAKEKGYFHSKETREKMSKIASGKILSEKELNRLKTCNIGRISTNRIPILGLNILENKVIYFDYIYQVEKSLGIKRANITKVLNNSRKTAGGYYFCKIDSTCPIKPPLNGETPEEDNPVLNQYENIVNA